MSDASGPPHDCDRSRHEALARALAAVESTLLTPALVIDLDAAEHNIHRLVERLGPGRWSPHIKTVKQSALILPLLEAGVRDFKCATLDELALLLGVVAAGGFEGVEILLAYPIADAMLDPLVTLASRHRAVTIRVLLDAPEHVSRIDRALESITDSARFEALLDVDVGMHRTGSAADRWRAAWTQRPSMRGRRLEVVGLHAYEGHLGWEARAEAQTVHDSVATLADDPLWTRWGDGCAIVSTSGSHAFHHAQSHARLSSGPWRHLVGPGTLVLSDLRSEAPARFLGLRQAAFVATRVVSRPTNDRLTLDAGTKAIAPDRPAPALAIVGHPELKAGTPSEEHHPMLHPPGSGPDAGSLLFAIPDHVCTTVNLHHEAVYVRGDRFDRIGPIEAMGHRPRWTPSP